ncbi:MAG TPA: hypothetical protein VGQ11_13525 [Candidatus Acidoferrales bacterium]|nr:hypothetical protein [Candidatus Acidoferrales bacterium]
MKRPQLPWLALALIALMVLPGCIVRSVHSWLRDDSIVYEEDLIGGWTGADDKGGTVAMTFVRGATNNYIVQYSDKESHGIFEGRLAKFGTDYFMDFKPKEEPQGVDGLLLFPTHTVARLEISSSTLVVRTLNYDEVKSAAKMERLRDLKYAWEGDELLITSSSSDLQAFLLGLSRDSNLYAPPLKLARRK